MSEPRSELATAFLRLNRVFAGLALVSGVINCLALSSSIFMLQVYDRVLSSRSEPTLATLCVLVVLLLGFQGVLEAVRSRILTRVSGHLHAQLGSRVFSCVLALPLRSAVQDDGLTPVRDLDTLRHFVAGPGPSAFFDLPWMPLYLLFVYALHPFLGLLATFGALILVALTVSTEMMSRGPQRALATQNAQRIGLGLAGRRNAEVLRAMGFGERVTERWLRLNTAFLAEQRRAGDIVGGLGAASRALRILLQSLILALGAWLTIRGQMTAGAIIAASIATTRALAPVELAIGQWKSFVAARDSWRRLARVLSALPPPSPRLDLPAPVASVVVEQLSVAAPGQRRPSVRNVSFALRAGQGLGIIGPSAAGKSTLLRALVGVWPPVSGAVRLDGAALDQWGEALGRHIGYLPQDVELLAGTVAANIARFEENPAAEAVIAAAMAAGVHEMILSLPDGYETEIGEGGEILSAGQRQRLALARALYRDPFLVVLDEPNSNLDAEGEDALTEAIQGVRARGGIVVVVAHRPAVLAGVDRIAIMRDGALQAFGPHQEVLRRMRGQPGSAGSASPSATDQNSKVGAQ
ncbi:type I secretion system permease/ATPase [Chelatococcus composti]|jgi:PrtD family type I secretion system ABC transporter|uniref:ATP-binding cassette subfamily C protein n=1 Tax=Chelatococcus composti TaxID=1743235 RepID=A0A841K8I4_9HYPH|nr:type I secretion system permease/ATPase [Chelatococcus composti]MBB6169148.1 ATP-binding cassette subfamily C protein [Chelatococcus composti]MBS7735970.1 type I secretion system permease/ATPase [Chelatococcus composti]GGG45554.1 type I secretion protein [Chelatococcus composti]